MNKAFLKSQILNILQKYPIVGVYIYGSKISGKTTALSDLDIAILLEDQVPPKNYFHLRLEIQDMIGKILKNEKIDLAILNEVSPLLAQNVIAKGKLIFCSDKDKIAHFACQTLKKYDDALYLRETYYKFLEERALQGKLGKVERS